MPFQNQPNITHFYEKQQSCKSPARRDQLISPLPLKNLERKKSAAPSNSIMKEECKPLNMGSIAKLIKQEQNEFVSGDLFMIPEEDRKTESNLDVKKI